MSNLQTTDEKLGYMIAKMEDLHTVVKNHMDAEEEDRKGIRSEIVSVREQLGNLDGRLDVIEDKYKAGRAVWTFVKHVGTGVAAILAFNLGDVGKGIMRLF